LLTFFALSEQAQEFECRFLKLFSLGVGLSGISAKQAALDLLNKSLSFLASILAEKVDE